MVDGQSDMPLGGTLEEATVEEFAVSFRGELIRPEDYNYDETRKIYNAMIDKRPALIVRPTGTSAGPARGLRDDGSIEEASGDPAPYGRRARRSEE